MIQTSSKITHTRGMHGWFISMTVLLGRIGKNIIFCQYSSQITLNLVGASPTKNYQQYYSVINIPSRISSLLLQLMFYAQAPSKEIAAHCRSLQIGTSSLPTNKALMLHHQWHRPTAFLDTFLGGALASLISMWLEKKNNSEMYLQLFCVYTTFSATFLCVRPLTVLGLWSNNCISFISPSYGEVKVLLEHFTQTALCKPLLFTYPISSL